MSTQNCRWRGRRDLVVAGESGSFEPRAARVRFPATLCPQFSLLVEEAPQQAGQSSQECLSSTRSQTGVHGGAREAVMMDAEKPLGEAKVAASRAIPRKSSTHWPTRPYCFSRSWPGKLTHCARRILPSDESGIQLL